MRSLRPSISKSTSLGLTVILVSGLAVPTSAQPDDVVGDVLFPVACDPTVQPEFNRAVALLHSFEFEDARRGFSEVARRDSDCAMAHWGIAMTYYHPLWAPPTEEELSLGTSALERAKGLPSTAREKDYIAAIEAFYRDREEMDHRSRAARYENVMATVYDRNPEDPEAKIFYALAMLSNADPTDKTYEIQKRTGAMLEPLFARLPNHPGLAHYIIHSYDYPPLAGRALEVRDYVDSLDLNWKNSVVAFNAGAIPVRYALERRRWLEAASLPGLGALEQAGGNYQARSAVALRYWAQAVGAARSGDTDRANAAQRELERLAEELSAAPSLWARNTSEGFRLQGAAWIALSQGNAGHGLQLMRAAARLEDQTDKSNLSPGRVLPAREQLGDMLMETNLPKEALREYQKSFSRAPRRLNGLLGAARAALAAGNETAAADYYRELLLLASPESSRAQVIEAGEFIEGHES